MVSFGSIVLIVSSCMIASGASYNTSLSTCGTPSNVKTTSGYECTGALFTTVDINQFNTLKSEAGCVAGMLGLSTQLTGHHCLAFRNCPGAGCTCEVRRGCSSSKATADTTKACLYGVNEASECPADTAGGSSPVPTSSAVSRNASAIIIIVLVAMNCFMASGASYNTSLSTCGTPSNVKTTSGYECTGALFTAVDINQFNTLKSEAGCVAGMLGLSTQLKGYHCLAFKNCPGAACTCEVRQGCSSSKAAADTTKACLYGVKEANECPADTQAPAPTSSAMSRKGAGALICTVAVAAIVSSVIPSLW